ncbi:hypothetical protein [Psychrobacter sp. I-STPA6b]|uniref:hypothetical protein n=1 Tax=Psychrobacter sp. I-STPA6b TaxID=2585718 RepID=UPI001D0CAABD|nr:hypothetical protein [Psychrobacter sp. I-STPA6b]
MISGGANGGFAFALGSAAAAMLVCAFVALSNPGLIAISASMTAPFILGLVGPIIALFAILIAVMAYKYRNDNFIIGCFLVGLMFSIGIALGDVEFGGDDKKKKSKSRLLALIGNVMGGVSVVNSWGTCYGL